MPNRPMCPCSRHRAILIPVGGVCPKCMGEPVAKAAAEAREKEDSDRPSAAKRGYGRAHTQKRRELLRRSPYCVDPYGRHPTMRKPAVIRDHIIPLAAGGTDDESNEQGLCQSCHNYKMYRDGSKGRGSKMFSSGGRRLRVAFDKSFSPNTKKSGN
jgi:5-methylcytosine-specific restriction protein A